MVVATMLVVGGISPCGDDARRKHPASAATGLTGTIKITPDDRLVQRLGGRRSPGAGSPRTRSATSSSATATRTSPRCMVGGLVNSSISVSCTAPSLSKLVTTSATGTVITTFPVVEGTVGPPCGPSPAAGHVSRHRHRRQEPDRGRRAVPVPTRQPPNRHGDVCTLTYGDEANDSGVGNISFGSSTTTTTGGATTTTRDHDHDRPPRRPPALRPPRRGPRPRPPRRRPPRPATTDHDHHVVDHHDRRPPRRPPPRRDHDDDRGAHPTTTSSTPTSSTTTSTGPAHHAHRRLRAVLPGHPGRQRRAQRRHDLGHAVAGGAHRRARPSSSTGYQTVVNLPGPRGLRPPRRLCSRPGGLGHGPDRRQSGPPRPPPPRARSTSTCPSRAPSPTPG